MIKDKHTLTPKYLLINYALALLLYAILLGGAIYDEMIVGNTGVYYVIALTLSLLLFPFSRFCIEKIALLFSTKKFWTTGFFQETVGKNGLWAIFYMFCFAAAIPLGGAYLVYRVFNKSGLVNRPHETR